MPQRLSAAVDVRRDTRLALTTAADAEREILHRELAAAHKELDAQRTNLMAAEEANAALVRLLSSAAAE